MTEERTEEQLPVLALSDFDAQNIAEAQRLAALDPDIRLAMADVWWTAIAVALNVANGVSHRLPGNPFSALGMEAAGYRPHDF